jgi:pimeloyl-ACP methyl ester carboxylesterase
MATIIPKLFNIYRAAGYEPITGYSPFHFFNLRDVPFTVFLKHNTISGCPGLALQEIMFVEQFRDFIAPQRVLIIGNAYGWSTIALALTFPSAKVVAIDPDIAGVNFTNDLIAKNGLSARAVAARSPESVESVVKEYLGGPVDFSLIDAVHTNETMTADFSSIKVVATDNAFYLFHDVINWNMISGFNEILIKYQLKGKVFTRTASGMALAYDSLAPAFENYLDCFSEPPGTFLGLRSHYFANYADPIPAFHDSLAKK